MKSREFPALLSRDELLGLAALAGVKAIVGVNVDPKEWEQAQSRKKEIDQRLSALGLLSRKTIPAVHRQMVDTLFHPERALFVVRDRPDIGKQILIFLSRKGHCVLHSFPKAGQHRVVAIRPNDIETMLAEWFPAREGIANDAILLSETQMNELIAAESDETPSCLANINPSLARNLWTSLRTQKWSGSFLLLHLKDGKVLDAESWNAWSNAEFTWVGERYNEPGILRLVCGGDRFIGLRRELVRWLGQFEAIVRAYSLSSEELAYALTLLNRPDLSAPWIKDVSPKEAEERLQNAAQSLQVRGLCRVSPRGFPTLAGDLEQALAPMLVPSVIGRIRTSSRRGHRSGSIYVMKNRSFCAHFQSEKQHIIESGKIGWLPSYLMGMFQGFGAREIQNSIAPPISLQALTDCLEQEDETAIEKHLIDLGFAKGIAAQLAEDIHRHEYRVSINGILPTRTNGQDPAIPTLLLLKGLKRDWLFAFPDAKAETMGETMQANRKILSERLGFIFNHPA